MKRRNGHEAPAPEGAREGAEGPRGDESGAAAEPGGVRPSQLWVAARTEIANEAAMSRALLELDHDFNGAALQEQQLPQPVRQPRVLRE